jgi:hypothetical protein
MFQEILNCHKVHKVSFALKIWSILEMVYNRTFTMQCCKLTFILDMLTSWTKCYPWRSCKNISTTCMFLKLWNLGTNNFLCSLHHTNFKFNHWQFIIQTNNHFYLRQFGSPNILKNSIKFPFKLPRFLIRTKICESMNFSPSINNVKGRICKHWHIKDFKVLLHYYSWTMFDDYSMINTST